MKIANITNKLKPGQLLIEVLIGLGIMAILVAAIVPLLVTSISATSKENKNSVAVVLAKEQIEAAKAIKEANWNDIYFPTGTTNKGPANPYHAEVSGSSWILASGVQNQELNNVSYSKSLVIENVTRDGLNGAGNINPGDDDPSTQKITAIVSGFGGLPVTITEYFTRWQNEIWNETNWVGQSGNQVDTGTSGQIQLAKVGGQVAGNYGNRFLLTSSASIGRMNNQNIKTSLRFKAQSSGQIDQLRIYIHEVNNGNLVTYRYGIQADNGSGFPDGNFLGSGTANFSSTGWQTVTLDSNASVTSGGTYHLVVEHSLTGQSPSNQRYIGLRNSQPQNLLVPFDSTSDNQQNTLFYNGAWAVQNRQPMYVLRFNDGSFEGNSYDTISNISIFGNTFQGERFTVSSEKTISAVSFYIRKNANQDPADSLYITLKDLSNNQNLINNVQFVSGSDLTTTFQWKTYSLPSNQTLVAGRSYRLYLSSPGSVAGRRYEIYNISNPDNAGANAVGWNGTNGLVSRSTNGGSTWTEDATVDHIDMTGFNFNTVEEAYAPFGEFFSVTHDVGDRAGFNRISWTELDLPSGTTIKFQLAAKNSDSGWVSGDYVGPQGTTADWYTLSTGENIWTGWANNRYLKYKIRLETSNQAVTPIVSDVNVNLSP